MIEFFRWIIGYVEFVFDGGFTDGFINDCYKTKINLHNIKRTETGLYGECVPSEYFKLHRPALKHGGRLRIIKRHGLLFPALKIQNRVGIMLGVLAFIALINFFGGFVWQIDVNGNESISDSEILTFLEQNGYYEGVYSKSVDSDLLESLMMASFKNLAWVSINKKGSTATVEVREAVMQPEVVNTKGYANLKATKDGIIVSAKATNGWQVAKVGDGVTKGDLLVSGIYESENNKINLYTHASGVYIARVEEKFSITVSRQQTHKEYADTQKYKSIVFFGIRIPLYVGSSVIQESDSTQCAEYIRLNGKRLPIGIIEKNVKPYSAITVNLSDKELKMLAEEEIEKRLSSDYDDCEVIKKNIKIDVKESSAVAECTMTCLEDIGEEVEIKTKKE